MSRLLCALLATVLLASTNSMNPVQDASAPPAFSVVLENAYVRITQAGIPHGVKSSSTVPAGVSAVVIRLRPLVFASGIHLAEMQPFRFDRALFLKSGKVSNHADSDLDGILEIHIELKDFPPASAFEKDAVKLDPSHNKVLFENDRVRVVDVHFGLGEKGPVVDKRPRVIILLNDMHADVARHEGDTPSPRDGKAGVIQWSLGGSQATMNRSETKLDNIVVEIKGK
jgi:hypothetical protein